MNWRIPLSVRILQEQLNLTNIGKEHSKTLFSLQNAWQDLREVVQHYEEEQNVLRATLEATMATLETVRQEQVRLRNLLIAHSIAADPHPEDPEPVASTSMSMETGLAPSTGSEEGVTPHRSTGVQDNTLEDDIDIAPGVEMDIDAAEPLEEQPASPVPGEPI